MQMLPKIIRKPAHSAAKSGFRQTGAGASLKAVRHIAQPHNESLRGLVLRCHAGNRLRYGAKAGAGRRRAPVKLFFHPHNEWEEHGFFFFKMREHLCVQLAEQSSHLPRIGPALAVPRHQLFRHRDQARRFLPDISVVRAHDMLNQAACRIGFERSRICFRARGGRFVQLFHHLIGTKAQPVAGLRQRFLGI